MNATTPLRTLIAGRKGRFTIFAHTERVCVRCGCTDSHACPGGCSWVVKHKHSNTGVCSACANSN